MNNIFLIGYRCTGKSTVGLSLRDLTGWTFIDMDIRLVEECGRTVREIVEDHGWEGFRRMERDLMRRIADGKNQIVATGGGVVLDPRNVKDMQRNGFTAWLRATARTIRERMALDEKTDAQRPALTDKGILEEIDGVLRQRRPLYEGARDIAIDTDSRTVEDIAQEILQKARERNMADSRILLSLLDPFLLGPPALRLNFR